MLDAGERRVYQRRRKAVVIKFSLINRGNKEAHGITGNIGSGGLMLYTTSDLEKDEVLRIERHRELPFMTAAVRWTKKIDGIVVAGLECTHFRTP